jgi:hypothetical protein
MKRKKREMKKKSNVWDFIGVGMVADFGKKNNLPVNLSCLGP